MEVVPISVAFLAGMVSFLSPCVLPIVPGYLAFVSGASFDQLADAESASRWRAALHSVFFILGFGAVFVLLGASAGAIGESLRGSLGLIQAIGGAFILLFGLLLLGFIRVPALLRERRPKLVSRVGGPGGALIAGVAFGAGWTPCIGPVLASILIFAGLEATLGEGVVLLIAYALGLGVPFILAALFFHWFIVAAGVLRRWSVPLERATGGVLVLIGLLLITGHFSLLTRYLASLGQLFDLAV